MAFQYTYKYSFGESQRGIYCTAPEKRHDPRHGENPCEKRIGTRHSGARIRQDQLAPLQRKRHGRYRAGCQADLRRQRNDTRISYKRAICLRRYRRSASGGLRHRGDDRGCHRSRGRLGRSCRRPALPSRSAVATRPADRRGYLRWRNAAAVLFRHYALRYRGAAGRRCDGGGRR